VSEDVKASISARHRNPVQVLVHGIDVERVRADLATRDTTRRELGVDAGESLVVTVANLREGKNYPGLIEAAGLVVQRDVPARFVTAGQGQLADEVAALHRASGLGDRFRLLGYRDDTTRLIAAADLFVLASHHEGLPVTVMEALTLGVPVVATSVGGIPEAVSGRRRRDPRTPARRGAPSPTPSNARSSPRFTHVSSRELAPSAIGTRMCRRSRRVETTYRTVIEHIDAKDTA